MSASQNPPTTTPATIQIADYQPHQRNYNGHPDRQIERIAASLRKFGQVRPIVTWRRYIIAGHGVVIAARSLGWTEIAAAMLPDDYPEHLALAYLAADNELARMGDPDQAALAAILEDSRAVDAELLQAIGYDDRELGELLAQIDRRNADDADPQETEADRLAAQWQTAAGQLWQLGPHRIICGDSTDPATWARLMDGEAADLIWTDPPYGVDYAEINRKKSKLDGYSRVQTDIVGDADPIAAAETTRAALTAAHQHSRPGAAIYAASADGPHLGAAMAALTGAGWMHKQTLSWIKQQLVPSLTADYHYQHEPILYGWKPGAAHTWIDIAPASSVIDDEAAIRRMDKPALIALIEQMRNDRGADVIRVPRPQASTYHPTMKPPALIIATARNNTAPGDLIADPFGGSGSTLIAAHQMERRARLIELSPGYVAVTLQRYHDATGDTPRRIDA